MVPLPEDSDSAGALCYVVLLSGTHVTGKETLAASLCRFLGCPWLKAEAAHTMARTGARSQAGKGYDHGEVFGRIWFSKLQRMGLSSDGSGSKTGCAAVITSYATRKVGRDAMRSVMRANSIKIIFVILQISEETLSGRTLGAEEPELAERIMGEKIADIQEPLEEELERDVITIDSMRDVDSLFEEIKGAVESRRVCLTNDAS